MKERDKHVCTTVYIERTLEFVYTKLLKYENDLEWVASVWLNQDLGMLDSNSRIVVGQGVWNWTSLEYVAQKIEFSCLNRDGVSGG